MDGGPFVITPGSNQRSKLRRTQLRHVSCQVFSEKEIGLHWQIHKHGADYAAATGEKQKMPVAICMGGPPELIFSAIAPPPTIFLNTNLPEFLVAARCGLLSTNTGLDGAC